MWSGIAAELELVNAAAHTESTASPRSSGRSRGGATPLPSDHSACVASPDPPAKQPHFSAQDGSRNRTNPLGGVGYQGRQGAASPASPLRIQSSIQRNGFRLRFSPPGRGGNHVLDGACAANPNRADEGPQADADRSGGPAGGQETPTYEKSPTSTLISAFRPR